MRRRDVIVGLVLASALSRAAAQQRGQTFRIAIVSPATPVTEMGETGITPYSSFLKEPRHLGYVEGQNLVVERYSGGGRIDHYPEMVGDVVRAGPDAVLTTSDNLLLEFAFGGFEGRCKNPGKMLKCARRHTHGRLPPGGQAVNAAGEQAFCFEGYTLDLKRGCLRVADREIELRPKSFELLRYPVENAGRLVAKDELVKALWPDVIVTDESLTRCVSDVRLALGDNYRRIIKTVTRRGYLFAAPVLLGATGEQSGAGRSR